MREELAETVTLLGDLVAFPTISDQSNLEMIVHLAGRLETAGATVHIFPDETGTKANLFATLGPEIDGGIVLSGHSDVVPVADQEWTSDPFALREAAGRLYGRGTCDMKGFIAAATIMAPHLAEVVTDRPLHFSFTYDEEVGCFGARALVDSLQALDIRPGVALIGEPTEMQVIEGHKGCNEYSTHFHGLAGHGSGPDKGVNAVEYAARFVTRLLELRDVLRARAPEGSRFDPPWTTISTGALTGGVAHNVIPSTARVDWEMRPVQAGDAEFVKEDLRRYCDEVLLPEMRAVYPEAAIETEIIGEIVGLLPTDPNEARRIMMTLTGATGAHTVPFGTEAGIFQAFGMSAVVCGPGSIDQAHKADEFVSLDQLDQCVGMLERLGQHLTSA